ncbi:small Trp-rich protein [Oxalobacteraceae bacterium GrIS 2.11]
MILILLTITLAALKYFDMSFMANVSWWWVIGLFFFTFIWFEFFERVLGLDKKKAHAKHDQAQKIRAKRSFDKK